MNQPSDMKYTLFRRKKRSGEEIAVGWPFVMLIAVILGFVLTVLDRFLH